MSTHGASSKPRADADGAPANDIAKEFAKHNIPLDAKVCRMPSTCVPARTHSPWHDSIYSSDSPCVVLQPPTFFINLNREMHELASDIVNSPEMSGTMRELRQVRVTTALTPRKVPCVCICHPHTKVPPTPHLIPACTYTHAGAPRESA